MFTPNDLPWPARTSKAGALTELLVGVELHHQLLADNNAHSHRRSTSRSLFAARSSCLKVALSLAPGRKPTRSASSNAHSGPNTRSRGPRE